MALLAYPKHFIAIADKVSAVCPPINLVLLVGLLILAGVYLRKRRHLTAYLIVYACSEGIANCRVPVAGMVEHIRLDPSLDTESISFMTRMLESSSFSDESILPPSNFYIPPHSSLLEAHAEVELVVFPAIDDVLAKTCVAPEASDVLVVNCSVVAPVPSISDMIINRYRLRDDVQAVNLSGMGCSAGKLQVQQRCLGVHPAGGGAGQGMGRLHTSIPHEMKWLAVAAQK